MAVLVSGQAAFPYTYHWDEPGKASQVMEGSRNLRHPLLMLNAADWVARIFSTDRESAQVVTETGRRVSAGLAGLSVALLILAAGIIAGPAAALLSGLLIFHPQLFELSHFFKEDTALLFGWSATLLCLLLYNRNPNMRSVACCGAAAALAASGKYIGILFAASALLYVLFYSPNRRHHLTMFLGVFIGLFILINHQLVLQPGLVRENLQLELMHQFNNVTGKPPPWIQWMEQPGWLGLIAAIPILIWLLRTPRRETRTVRWVGATILLYFLLLCVIERQVPRYLLPVRITFWWLAGIAMIQLVKNLSSHTWRTVTVIGLMLMAGAVRSKDISGMYHAYQRDTRQIMTTFVEQAAQPGDMLMMDFLAWLPTPALPAERIYHWDPSISTNMYETLQEWGYTLVVVHDEYRAQYFQPMPEDEIGQFRDRNWRIPFYRMLETEAQLLHTVTGKPDTFLQPTLHLYRIASPGDSTP